MCLYVPTDNCYQLNFNCRTNWNWEVDMSVTDPLLRELKGYTLQLIQSSENDSIKDDNEALEPFCRCLETIFQTGLGYNSSFITAKELESWYWIEDFMNTGIISSYKYVSICSHIKNSRKVTSPRGKLRLFIRMSLNNKCLNIPVEVHVREQEQSKMKYNSSSILGNEILGEIFLSVLLQCSHLSFKLNEKNCLFLDETWTLPDCVLLEFVPCKSLGIHLNFVSGKPVVVGLKENCVAGEDGKVEIGDVLDELNGVHISSKTKSQLQTIMKKGAGKPIEVHIIKAFMKKKNGIFPPINGLLKKTRVDPSKLLAKINVNSDQREILRPGIPVMYCGAVCVGNSGEVGLVQTAMRKLFSHKGDIVKTKAYLEILEMAVRITDEKTGEVLLKHSYMEISSCGCVLSFPSYFAYIAGNEACSVAQTFTCYIFYCASDEHIQTILQSIGQGFQRTHFAV